VTPVAVAAGLATLRHLNKPSVYQELEKKSEKLAEGLAEAAHRAKIPYFQTRVGSMLGGFFTEGPVIDFAGAKKSDTKRYAKFFHGMLNHGVYLAPSQFEAILLSTAHTAKHIRQTIVAAQKVFPTL